MTERPPALDIDPFSDEFLAEPYPFHEALREAGPVVWLRRYSVFAAARHAEVQSALQDWRTFSSAAGVRLADLNKEEAFRPRSIILEADPPSTAASARWSPAWKARSSLGRSRSGRRASSSPESRSAA